MTWIRSDSSNARRCLLQPQTRLCCPQKALKSIPFRKGGLSYCCKASPSVQLESDPELFLEREDGDVDKAANLIVLYWTTT
jgi:hypothetical protein